MTHQADHLTNVKRRPDSQFKPTNSPTPNKDECTKLLAAKSICTLSTYEKLGFEFIQISPIIVVLGILHTTHNFLLTLMVFHALLIYLPIKFLKHKKVKFNVSLREEISKLKKFKNLLIWFLIVPSAGILISYLVIKKVYLQHNPITMNVPTLEGPLYSILLGIDFIIINPILEELFWRVFCYMFVDESKVRGQINVSIHFALYHFFVVYFICQSTLLSAAVAFNIFGLGMVLTYVNKKYGLVSATVFHLGVDLVAAICLIDMGYNFLHIY
jgi:hypothetical protein